MVEIKTNSEAKELIGDNCVKIINDLHVMVEQDDKLGRQIMMKNIMNRFSAIGRILNSIDSEKMVERDINEVLALCFKTES